MKTREKCKAIEVLSRKELLLVKGGEGRDYVIVIIDGEEVRLYV
nr:hypothetical protein [Ancylomarina sp. DW003]